MTQIFKPHEYVPFGSNTHAPPDYKLPLAAWFKGWTALTYALIGVYGILFFGNIVAGIRNVPKISRYSNFVTYVILQLFLLVQIIGAVFMLLYLITDAPMIYLRVFNFGEICGLHFLFLAIVRVHASVLVLYEVFRHFLVMLGFVFASIVWIPMMVGVWMNDGRLVTGVPSAIYAVLAIVTTIGICMKYKLMKIRTPHNDYPLMVLAMVFLILTPVGNMVRLFQHYMWYPQMNIGVYAGLIFVPKVLAYLICIYFEHYHVGPLGKMAEYIDTHKLLKNTENLDNV